MATAYPPGGARLLGPGIAWLVLFYVVPLALHLPRQPRASATRSAGSSRSLDLDNYARAFDTGLPAHDPELAAIRVDHDDPVPRHRLSRRLLDLALRRPAQDPAARPGDAAVLDELPHPHLRLDDRPPATTGSSTRSCGARPDHRADHPAQHRPVGDPGHDVRVPAVRDPAAVRVDRPAGREPRGRRTGPVRERPLRLPST